MSAEAPSICVRYPTAPGGEVTLTISQGTSILAASLAGRIPHAAVCGGRGRCSACRVRVLEGAADQPPPDSAELATLRPLLARDPSLRLACRLKPRKDIAVEPVMHIQQNDQSPDLTGRLQTMTVMFVDLRGFSRMAAKRHPYDVVFTLNRYFDLAATAIAEAGGRVDKFIGDGIMALFGIGEDDQTGPRAALRAAKAISSGMHALNQELESELTDPLRIGMGIHFGTAILGRFGWGLNGEESPETAIGDVVNIASRLESLSKTYSSQLVMSEAVAQCLGEQRTNFDAHHVEIPNHDGLICLRVVPLADHITL